jgi:hypothetical protein
MVARVRLFAHRRGNVYMREIARLLGDELADLGVESELVTSGMPGREPPGTVLDVVVAPHEYAVFEPMMQGERAVEVMSRCAAVTTEQPGTPWFSNGVAIVRSCPAVVDVSPVAAELMAAAGIAAEALRFGYTPHWDRWGGGRDAASRPRVHDITVLAAVTPHRERALHRLAPVLAEWQSHLLLFDNSRPAVERDPWFVHGDALLELMATSRVLLNVRRDEGRRYFEWIRCLPAVLNGTVVVSEPSFGADPLRAVEHLVAAPADGLGAHLTALLDDEPRRKRLASAAYEAIRSVPSLSASVERFVARAADALDVPIDLSSRRRSVTAEPRPAQGSVAEPPVVRRATTIPRRVVVQPSDGLADVARELAELDAAVVVLERPGHRWAPRALDELVRAYEECLARGEPIVGVYGVLATSGGGLSHHLPWDMSRLRSRPFLGLGALVVREPFLASLRAADALCRRHETRHATLDDEWRWHLPWLVAAGRGMHAVRVGGFVGWADQATSGGPAPDWLNDALAPGHWPETSPEGGSYDDA